MTKTAKSKIKSKSPQGKFPMQVIRPNAFDLAALDVLTAKNNDSKSGIWRLGLARLVDFESVREQVVERMAHYQ